MEENEITDADEDFPLRHEKVQQSQERYIASGSLCLTSSIY